MARMRSMSEGTFALALIARLPGGETASDGLVEAERRRTPDRRSAGRVALASPTRRGGPILRCAGSRRRLVAAFERACVAISAPSSKMRISSARLHIEHAPSRRVGDAVEIAADAHHAFMGDAPFELAAPPGRGQRQWHQRRLFLGEGLVDDPTGGGVHPRIGDRIEPMPKLGIEIVEIAERAAEEEVLADVAERPLDLALRLRPDRAGMRAAGSHNAEQIEKRGIVDDETVGILADDRGLHAVVEHLAGAPSIASRAAIWQRRTSADPDVRRSGPRSAGRPRTMEKSQTIRRIPGWSANSTSNCAKSTCACSPGAVSKRFEAICARRPHFA